jgi:dihydropteroate synthase
MKKTKLVGILNITPDSFTGDGLYKKRDLVSKKIEELIAGGVDVIDIGAVSTRPNATIPNAKEEISRFKEIIPCFKSCKAEISIDSFNFETITYLMDNLDISWINDQSGAKDQRIVELLKGSDIKIAIMHNIGLPAGGNNISEDQDVTLVVKEWFLDKIIYLKNLGIRDEQIILDPGIGFGKNSEQSWKIIRDAESFIELGFPMLYGHSRKSFFNNITQLDFAQRDLETIIVSYHLANSGIDFLRIHDVNSHFRMLKVRAQIRGEV